MARRRSSDRFEGRVVLLGLLLVACRVPNAGLTDSDSPATPSKGARAPEVEAQPVSTELIADTIDRGGFFELSYCRAYPPALVEAEPRDAGCELPTHTCVRDEAGRVLENGVGADANGGPPTKLLRYGYDDQGRLSTVAVERSGHCVSESTYERDEQGRVVREVMRDHCESKVAFWIRYEYGGDGRVTAIEQVKHYGALDMGTGRRTLEWDGAGRLAGSRDEDGTVVELVYNRFGHCEGLTENGVDHQVHERAADGTVMAVRNRWYRSVLERDEQGRIIRRVVEDLDGHDPPAKVEFHYDEAGHCIRVEAPANACKYDPPYPGPCPGELEPQPGVGCVVNY